MKHKAGYLSIKQASELVGVHADTIRRLVKQHQSSKNIIRAKGTKSPYYINELWLRNIYAIDEPHTSPRTSETSTDEPTNQQDENNKPQALYEALVNQLTAKDEQIKALQQIIVEKEANTTKLQDQFQKLLATQKLISEPQDQHSNQPTVVEPELTTQPSRQKNPTKKEKTKTKKPTDKKTKPTKKRFWSRLKKSNSVVR